MFHQTCSQCCTESGISMAYVGESDLPTNTL